MTRQPDFATQPRAARVPAWLNVLLLVGLLAVAAAVALSWRTSAQAREALENLAAVRRDVEQQAARLKALEAVRQANPAASATPARVVSAVAAVLPRDARLERLAIDYERGVSLEMQVTARSPEAWDRTLEAFERCGELSELQVGPETRESPLSVVVRARWSGDRR